MLEGKVDYLIAVCSQNLRACEQVKPLPQPAMPRGPAVSKHGVTRDRSRPAIPIPQGNSFEDRERISSDIRRSPQKPILSGCGEQPQASVRLNPEAAPFSGNFVGPPQEPASSGLRPIISSGQPQNDGWLFNYYGIQPRPQLTLAKFDGDVLKFGNFRRQFGKYVEEIYSDYNDRMSFLENLCVGQAQEVILGLSCLEIRKMAYEMAWTRLEKRFGNPRKLLTLVKQDLLDGPPIGVFRFWTFLKSSWFRSLYGALDLKNNYCAKKIRKFYLLAIAHGG